MFTTEGAKKNGEYLNKKTLLEKLLRNFVFFVQETPIHKIYDVLFLIFSPFKEIHHCNLLLHSLEEKKKKKTPKGYGTYYLINPQQHISIP